MPLTANSAFFQTHSGTSSATNIYLIYVLEPFEGAINIAQTVTLSQAPPPIYATQTSRHERKRAGSIRLSHYEFIRRCLRLFPVPRRGAGTLR